ncbi:sensor histidine kinase [Marinomonas sp. 2405UD68-3]|uniref:sensor histidine kinase n=1 Tax=Marinomonas sp. 2405UD68-3 TaxID=3391835 RepID=UPI0039C997C2
MPKSIQFKLLAWIIGTLLFILSMTGWYSYTSNKQIADEGYQLMQVQLTKRLSLSLASGFWQLDLEYIQDTLDAELLNEAVVAIKANDQQNISINRQIGQTGEPSSLELNNIPHHEDVLKVDIIYNNTALGYVEVFLTTEPFSKRIEKSLWEVITVQVIGIFFIGALLIYILHRYIFTPIKNLEKALFIARDLRVKEKYVLPDQRYLEWGTLVNGINDIIKKISLELTSRQQAEKNALIEKEYAEQAYNQLIETQDALIQVEKMAALGRLVAGIAHEISTPIGVTLTSASHLETATADLQHALATNQLKKSTLDEYLEVALDSTALILGNTKRAAHLIQSFKQVVVDQTNQSKREFSIQEYLNEIIHSLHPKLKLTAIKVNIECDQLILLNSYPGALSQVITNLVLNALLHAYEEHEKGEIHVTAQKHSDNRVIIKIYDDGKGITDDVIKKIFDPFFTTKQGQGKTGLGLHIVFNIVTQTLGGTINTASKVGEGTCFTLDIPMEAPSPKDSIP